MSLSLSVDGPGDAELISAVRGGDVDAYGDLFARHVDAARRLARQLAGPADADDLVSDAFAKVLTVLQRGGGPDLAFRAYLLTAVRRLHVDKIRAGSRLRPVDDLTPFDPGLPFQDTAVEGFDNAAAARAFASLPERWQMVLWHTEVEQQKPADIAVLLGMSANSVSALAYRAREGLRQAFLSQHATDPDDVDCAWTRDHLGAYVRGGLSRRDAKRVDDHLADCRACAAVYLELTEVNSGLAGLLAPLLLGAAGAKYASSLGGGAAGGAGATGFAGVQAWAAAHVGLAVIGGFAVTATALATIYGATHLQGHDAADVGSNALPGIGASPSAGSGQSPDGTGPGQTSSRGTDNNTASPGDAATSPVTTGTASPSTDAGTSPSTGASTDPSTEPGSTPPSGDPSTGPGGPTTGPTDPGDDPITFTSVPPIDPVFGSTYRVQATSASGKAVTFSVDATPGNACTIKGDLVSFDHAGTCVITGNLTARNAARAVGRVAGAGAAAGPTSKVFSQTVVIPQGKQKIDFDLGNGAQVDGDLPLKAKGGASGKDVTFTSETPGVCSLNGAGDKVRFHHATTCTVTAHQNGNEDYKPADDVSSKVDVDKGDQAITFRLPANAKVDDSLQLSATGGPSDNPVTFTGTPACSVNEAGNAVTMKHATSCVVTAHQDGNADYRAGSATETVDVGKGDQTVDFAPANDGQVGTDATLSATSSAGLDVRFNSTNDACTVTGSTVTFVHARPCDVTASAGNADYNDAGADQTIQVDKGDQAISFNAPTGAAVGGHDTLAATSSSGLDVTFGTTDSSCTVAGSTITYDHARPCVVTSSQAGNDDYNAAPGATRTVEIVKGTQTIDFTTVTDAKVGTDTTLHATSSAGLHVTFATTDNSCTVTGATVTYDHASPCTVTATQAGNDDWNDATTDQTISIGKGDQTIGFTPVTGAKVGTASPLQATTNAGLVVSFGSTSNACAVTESTVRFNHAGPCVVTATQAGSDDWKAAAADQTIEIGKGDQAITFTSTPPTSPAFGTTYTPTATSGSGGAVTFSIDPTTSGFGQTDQACRLADGTVTFAHAGACVIAADQAGTADYLAAPTARQSATTPRAAQAITFTSKAPASPAFGTTYSPTAVSDSGAPVTFSLAPATGNACTINATSTTVTFRHAGACVIAANAAGTDDFLPAPTTTQAVSVPQATQKIAFTSNAPASPAFGTTYTPTATSDSGGAVTFSIDPQTTNQACTIAGATVTFRHAGACVIAADQAGTPDYLAAPTARQPVSVPRAAQAITFTSTAPASPAFGSTYTVSATSDSGGPISFSLDPKTTNQACTIAGATVTFRHAGACVIAADQAGTPDYFAAPTTTQSVTVPKAAQSITFTSTPPSPAYVGTTYKVTATGGASGKTVLFDSATPAVCSVSGSTVSFLAAGSCTVTANQAGNDDYLAAPTVTQKVTVTPAVDLSVSAIVSNDPPAPDDHWHEVDVTVHDVLPGASATVSGDSPSDGVLVLPQFNCWFQVGGVCHVSSPPTTTTVKFFVWLPDRLHDAKVTFTVASDDSPDPDPSNDKVTVTVRRFDD